MKTAIVGAGAAGCFSAVNIKEMVPDMSVTVFEKSSKILSKLEVSGGGRCNCTNTFASAYTDGILKGDLSLLYPRGHRLMKKLLHVFSPKDTINWFESHGVKLKEESDGRIFPISDDSHTIINMFVRFIKKYGINIHLNSPITSLDELSDYDFVCITCGGLLHNTQSLPLTEGNVIINKPKPSLFGFNVKDERLRRLSGTSMQSVTVAIPKTKFEVCGTVLVTHRGLSGPCILKLSSFASVFLNECNYQTKLRISWIKDKDSIAIEKMKDLKDRDQNKQITNINPFALPARFWEYIIRKTLPNRTDIRYKDLTQKEINKIVNTLCNDELLLDGRNTNKEEFVTCGGVALDAVYGDTLQSKTNDRLFFAGEVLDIDGVTGGYNFQAVWTTAYIIATSIAKVVSLTKK